MCVRRRVCVQGARGLSIKAGGAVRGDVVGNRTPGQGWTPYGQKSDTGKQGAEGWKVGRAVVPMYGAR